MLETQAPLLREKHSVLADRRNVLLFNPVARENGFWIGIEDVVDVRHPLRRKPVNGGVADALVKLCPVLRHAEPPRQEIEEIVDRPGDDDVEVKKEHVAFEVMQRLLPKRELAPRRPRNAFGEIDWWQWLNFYSRIGTRRVIREADEARFPRRVPPDHRCKTVEVVGTVLLSPLDANDGLHGSAFHIRTGGIRVLRTGEGLFETATEELIVNSKR